MTAQRFRHVPVVEEGKLIGIVSIGDVVEDRHRGSRGRGQRAAPLHLPVRCPLLVRGPQFDDQPFVGAQVRVICDRLLVPVQVRAEHDAALLPRPL